MEDSQQDLGLEKLQVGQQAFEGGRYREAIVALEGAIAVLPVGSRRHGEAQMWLVMSYEAAGERDRALELCRGVSRHPDWETKQQGKRLLYILEAPQLRRRSEWMTEIPDLEQISRDGDDRWGAPSLMRSAPLPKAEKGYVIGEPTDPSKVEVQDDRFLWVVVAIVFLGVVGMFVWGA